jgi:hypothetical protein
MPRHQSAEDVRRYGYSIQALEADEPPELERDSLFAGFGRTLLRTVAATAVLLTMGLFKQPGKRESAQPQR